MWLSCTALLTAVQQWAAEYLILHWRFHLTSKCQVAYCYGPALYALSQGRGRDAKGDDVAIDNPDQRIAQVQ